MPAGPFPPDVPVPICPGNPQADLVVVNTGQHDVRPLLAGGEGDNFTTAFRQWDNNIQYVAHLLAKFAKNGRTKVVYRSE